MGSIASEAEEKITAERALALGASPVEVERTVAGQRDLVDRVLASVVAAGLLAELGVLFANVVVRALSRQSLLWSQEIAELALVVVAFVGGALAYRRHEHMAMRAVVERLPSRIRAPVAVFADAAVLAMGVAGSVLAVPMLRSRLHEHSPTLGLPGALFVVPFAAGMLLLAAFALERLWLARRAALASGLAGSALVAALLGGLAYLAGPLGEAALPLAAAAFFVLIAAGVPIGFVLALVSMLYLSASGTDSPLAATLAMQSSMSNFILLAIPFFILAGYVMTEGGLSRPLADFVRSLVGHLRGGLLQVIIVTMYIFSGISGSKVADVAAVGTSMNDLLEAQGYDPPERVAVLASAAVMGETVPPSIAMLVLGSITTLSMGALFVAGLLPAVVIAVCLMVLVHVRARLFGWRRQPAAPLRERTRAAVRAAPALLVPLLLAGGILFGVGTPTEVSSFAVVYALGVAFLVYRALSLGAFWRLVGDTGSVAGMILFIISAGSALSWTLTAAGLPDAIYAGLASLGGSSTVFLLVTVLTLIVMGAVLEGLPALLVFGPLLLPVAEQLGINPLHFGIVLILSMGLGSFTPPIGVGAYVTCSISGASMEQATLRMLPYLAVLLVGLLLVAFMPFWSLALPHLLVHSGG